jgi:adenylosuccinate synthase
MENSKKGFVDVLIGLQWGDEGKGKNIDSLLSSGIYSGVARFQGGANAGHTLEFDGKKFIGHIIPSGCLQKNAELYVGNGVVVDIVSLVKEIAELKSLGFDVTNRLYISHRAKLVTYMHPFIDAAEEAARSKGGAEKIGTTSRGIGPTYSDSRARRGLMMGDILFPDFDKKLAILSGMHMNFLNMYKNEYGYELSVEKVDALKTKWMEALEEVKKLQICDLSHLIQKRLREGKNILAEGAQGAMLDIDHGDYPNVTSSNVLPANVCLGLGVPHSAIRNVYGVIKSYTTKVGGGDFPARIKDPVVEKLFQDAGHEFGATTGRPRMCGWLDLFAIKYAIGLSGANKIFINKADICPTDKVKVVTGYKIGDKVLEDFPLRLTEVTDVVSEDTAGWGSENYGVTDRSKASPELMNYIEFLQDKLKEFDLEFVTIGTGPGRDQSFDLNK